MLLYVHLSHRIISPSISTTQHVPRIAIQRAVVLRVAEQRHDCSASRIQGPGGGPLLPENVQADFPRLEMDVRVEYIGREGDFGGGERVLRA